MMGARTFDELIENLLGRVALAGEGGASVADFKDFVREFYAQDGDEDGAAAAVDRPLLEMVWGWLLAHPQIWLEDEGRRVKLGLSEAEEKSHDPHGAQDDGEATTPADRQDTKGPRIRTSQDRVWHAIAGHGVDWAKVPAMEFALLTLILRAGAAGILQPDLVRDSGQDKRSVPKRTDRLHNLGYISKQATTTAKYRTTLLVHKRFIGAEKSKTTEEDVFTSGGMMLGPLFDYIFQKLEENELLSWGDLRRLLGVGDKKREARMLWRSVARLRRLGLIDFIKAKFSVQGQLIPYAVNSFKLARPPTARDRDEFLAGGNWKQGDTGDQLQDDTMEATEDNIDPAIAQEGDFSTVEDRIGDVEEENVNTAQWTASLPINNLLFEAIDAAGSQGLSSVELAKATVGTTWQRPLEQATERLTDSWEASQPPHLRHLAIVRDTKPHESRGSIFVYRSFAGHQSAVEKGEALWEAVRKPSARSSEGTFPAPQLDDYGFPKTAAGKFLRPGGYATLSQCLAAAKVKPLALSSHEPVTTVSEDGTETVTWGVFADGDDASDVGEGRASKPRASGGRRSKGNSLFPGVDEHEYQRLYREMKKNEQLDAAWEARARKLAKWRMAQDGARQPNGATAGTKRSAESAGLETASADRPPPKKRGRPSKAMKAAAAAAAAAAKLASLTDQAVNGDDVAPEAAADKPETSEEAHAAVDRNDMQRSEERFQQELDDILALKSPGAYFNPPLARKALPSRRGRSGVLLIKSSRLPVLDWPQPPSPDPPPLATAEQVDDVREASSDVVRAGARTPEPVSLPEAHSVADQDPDSRVLDEPGVGPSSQQAPSTPQAQSSIRVTRKRGRSLTNEVIDLVADDSSPRPSQIAPTSEVSASTSPVRAGATDLEKSATTLGRPADDISSGLHAQDGVADDGEGQSSPRHNEPAEPDEEMEDYVPEDQSDKVTASPRRVARKLRLKRGVSVGGGSVAHMRSKIILDMVQRCGGAMPAERDIVPPFAAAFSARLKGAPATEPKTVQKAMKSLADQAKLKLVVFTFRAETGVAVTKRIVVMPDVQVTDERVLALQKRMAEAFPRPYVPEEIWEPGTKPKVAATASQSKHQPGPRHPWVRDESARVQLLKPNEQQKQRAVRSGEAYLRRLGREERRAEKARQREAEESDDSGEEGPRVGGYWRSRYEQETIPEGMSRSFDLNMQRLAEEASRDADALLDGDSRARLANPGHDTARHANQPLSWIFYRGNGRSERVNDSHLSRSSYLGQRFSNGGTRHDADSAPPESALNQLSTPRIVRRRKRRDLSRHADSEPAQPQVARPATAFRYSADRTSRSDKGADPIQAVSEMTAFQNLMLAHAMTAVRALAGGIDGAVNWNVIDHIFRHDPRYNGTIFRIKWANTTKFRPWLAEELVADFQSSYLRAYEAGQVSPINYDRLEETDWDGIVEWSLRTLPKGVNGLPDLASERTALDERYRIQELKGFYGLDRGRMLKSSIPDGTRMDLLHDYSLHTLYPSVKDAYVAISLKLSKEELALPKIIGAFGARGDEDGLQELVTKDPEAACMLVKSIVRSDIFTPKGVYNLGLAQRRLAKYPAKLIDEAAYELLNDRVVTKTLKEALNPRVFAGDRQFAISEYFDNALRGHRYLRFHDLRDAAMCKAALDRAFRAGEASATIRFDMHDGANVTTTNLAAKGRTKIIPKLPPFDSTIGAPLPRISKWGWSEGNYKTNTSDLTSMEMISLEMAPTDTYECGNPLDAVTLPTVGCRFPPPPPVPSSSDILAPVPLWVDIHGGVMMEWWCKLLCYVVQTVHLRPYIGIEELVESFKNLVWAWELQLVLDWAAASGLLTSHEDLDGKGESVHRGWRSGEWWWLCLARAEDFDAVADGVEVSREQEDV